MARGDVVSAIASVAHLATLVYQPAAGVEALITEVGSGGWTGTEPNQVPAVRVYLYDGTNWSIVKDGYIGASRIWMPMKILVRNALYLAIENLGGATFYLSYCGVQTK